MVTEKGNTVTFPVTGVKQYYKKGIKAGRWVYVHFRGKFIGSSQIDTKQYDGSFTKVISVSDVDPMKVPEPTPTPSPEPKKKKQHLRARIVSVSTNTITFVPQTANTELNVPVSSVPVYFKGGIAPGAYVNITYTGNFNGESTSGMKIRGVTRRRSGYTFCPQYLFHCNRNYSWNNGQYCPDPDLRWSKNPLRPRKRPGSFHQRNGRRCGPPGYF